MTTMSSATPPRRTTSVVELTTGEASPPVWWIVHDLDGGVGAYRPLAAALGPGQSVRGLVSPFASSDGPTFTSAERLALRYVTDLRRHQADGPYRLCGVGETAVLAFDMARLLQRDRQVVELLALIDGGPGNLLAREASRVRPRRLAVGRSPLTAAARQHRRLCGDRWQPHPYAGRVDLLWARGTPSAGPTQGWGPLAEEVVVARIEVAHDDLLVPPGAAVVADALGRLVGSPAPGAAS